MRRYVLPLSAVFIAEAALYSALAPLLASYARNGEISKISAGVLSGSYAFGLIPGSLAAGWLTGRVGTRLTTIAGCAVFSASTAWFGFAITIETQTVARAVQGLSAGCMWSGALAWLINLTPDERRGEFLGIAAATSMLGTIVGPAIGILAVEVGKEAAYLGSAIAIALLIVPLYLTPTRQSTARHAGLLRSLTNSSPIRLATWLNLLGAASAASLLTLLPLSLERAGATPSTVGLIFLGASVVSAILAVPGGRFLDRRGATRTTQIGLFAITAVFAVLALDLPLAPLALTTIVAFVFLIVGLFIPAERLLFDGAAARGFSPGASASLLVLCIAVGESIGAPAGAAIATVTSESALFLTVATTMAYSAYRLRRDATQRVARRA
jgi:MFS family permease